MRIEKLNPQLEKVLLDRRSRADSQAHRVAACICADVERRRDAAVLHWARKLDGNLVRSVREMRIAESAIRESKYSLAPDFLRGLAQAAQNIRAVARQQLPRPWKLQTARGVSIAQIVRPLETVACYVPGGRFSLFSSLLMTAIPAQVAGVERIVVVCPKPNAAVLAAANLLGLREVWQLGGAQAIAAFAYGTRTIPRAEMICGPGNRYVAAAKSIVATHTKIDMLAGPTELLVLAAEGDPRFIAADLIAQAEHDPDAVPLLVTPSRSLARAVQAEVALQLAALPDQNVAPRALRANGRILLTPNFDSAIAFANRFAPEHLSIPEAGPSLLARIRSAGSVFLGPWSAQPFGDYLTGSNHVLPTSGHARARGGLSTTDFVKCITVQRVARQGARRLARAAQVLAQSEGLLAHARAATIRGTASARPKGMQ